MKSSNKCPNDRKTDQHIRSQICQPNVTIWQREEVDWLCQTYLQTVNSARWQGLSTSALSVASQPKYASSAPEPQQRQGKRFRVPTQMLPVRSDSSSNPSWTRMTLVITSCEQAMLINRALKLENFEPNWTHETSWVQGDRLGPAL